MHLPQHGEDRLVWTPNKSGDFTVKSAYKTLTSTSTALQKVSVPKQTWNKLWHSQTPHKVNLFIWKCLRHIVPTRCRISHYKPNIETTCVLCEETTNHLLLHCQYARTVWLGMGINVESLIHRQIQIHTWILTRYDKIYPDPSTQMHNIVRCMVTA